MNIIEALQAMREGKAVRCTTNLERYWTKVNKMPGYARDLEFPGFMCFWNADEVGGEDEPELFQDWRYALNWAEIGSDWEIVPDEERWDRE